MIVIAIRPLPLPSPCARARVALSSSLSAGSQALGAALPPSARAHQGGGAAARQE